MPTAEGSGFITLKTDKVEVIDKYRMIIHDTNMPKTSNLNSPFDYEGLRKEPLYKLLYHGSKNNFKDFNIDPTPIPILYPLNAPTAPTAPSAPSAPTAPTAPKSLEFKFTEPAPGEWCEFLGDFVPKK